MNCLPVWLLAVWVGCGLGQENCEMWESDYYICVIGRVTEVF